jgi:hypothetical protein
MSEETQVCALRLAEFWDLYTADLNPQQKKCARCRHCNEFFNHHKKSEQAKHHLNGCSQFRKLMNGMACEERPSWYTGVKRRNTSPQKGRQSLMDEHGVPALGTSESVKFEREVAMFFYMTGTSFVRVEDPHFRAACQVVIFSLTVSPF